MKILFLQDDFPPQSFGGAGISTYELALGMKKAGHEVFIITTCRNESEAGESEYHGLKVFKIASDYPEKWRAWVSLYNPRVVRRVEKILQKIRPDVVHANNVHRYLSYYCLTLAKRYARVVVWTARDTIAFTYAKLGTKRYLDHLDCRITWRDNLAKAGKRWNPFRNICIKRCLGYAHGLFAVSEALQKAFQQNGIGNVKVIHTGIDVSEYLVSQELMAHFRKKHGLVDKKVLLFAGRLSEAKGGEMVVEAMSAIAKEIPNAVLLVAGSADGYAREMQKDAKRLGIGERLVFTGWIGREDIKTAYAVADVVLVPSLYLDPFPRAVIEGMASGKPIIGTCYGGVSEIMADGVTGYVVNPFNVNEMTEKSLDLLRDPTKAERFGLAARERVRTEFSLERCVGAYLAHYKQLLPR